jgi:hypothetical protein
LIAFNELKCKIVHYGKEINFYSLRENGTYLESSDLERDLGVQFSSDLKWRTLVQSCAAKANSIMGRLKRTFTTKDIESC